jgi:hypothetical protein
VADTPLDQLALAGARLINAAADALVSYTRLQEKREKYLDQANAEANPAKDNPDPAFEQFQPGYFERAYGPKGAPGQAGEDRTG